MDIGAAGALSLFNYQMSVKGMNVNPSTSVQNSNASQPASPGDSTQGSAVLQALTAAYAGTSSMNALFPSTDSLSALAGSSGYLGSLVNGIYSASVASGNTSLAGLDLTQATVGGETASTARDLLSGLGPGSMDGFSASTLTANATLAMAAYTNAQNGVPSAVATGSTQTSTAQAAIQAAQMNLLG